VKAIIKILPITLLLLVAITHAGEKNAVMLEKVDDPLAGMASIMGAGNVAQVKSMMGDKSKATNYKHCIQNITGDKAFFKKMANEMAEEAAENGQYNDIKSVTLIEKCPLPANGKCDHGSRVEYFYNDSVEFLNDQKEGCEFFKKTWTLFDIPKVG
jgi:hypothetical protein